MQSRILSEGIESNISIGSLCVHATREAFLQKFPDLKSRVLSKNENPFSESMREAFREERKENKTQEVDKCETQKPNISKYPWNVGFGSKYSDLW
jgi:hypothetical protein